MDIIYCSRCNCSIPPGGLDEGRYFKLGEEIICPKCYYRTKPGEHSGDTVPVEPLKDESLLGAGRIAPASREQAYRPPTSRVGPAVGPRKTSTRVLPAARPPTSRAMPAAKPPTSRVMPTVPRRRSSESSARLRTSRESSALLRLILAVVLLLVIGSVAAALFIRARKSGGNQPGPAGNVGPTSTNPADMGHQGR